MKILNICPTTSSPTWKIHRCLSNMCLNYNSSLLKIKMILFLAKSYRACGSSNTNTAISPCMLPPQFPFSHEGSTQFCSFRSPLKGYVVTWPIYLYFLKRSGLCKGWKALVSTVHSMYLLSWIFGLQFYTNMTLRCSLKKKVKTRETGIHEALYPWDLSQKLWNPFPFVLKKMSREWVVIILPFFYC